MTSRNKLENLFNKEGLVEALLMKKVPKEFGYIKVLKDMIMVELDMILGLEKDEKRNWSEAKFQCPITGWSLMGSTNFSH